MTSRIWSNNRAFGLRTSTGPFTLDALFIPIISPPFSLTVPERKEKEKDIRSAV
jgi:hypothetical protein